MCCDSMLSLTGLDMASDSFRKLFFRSCGCGRLLDRDRWIGLSWGCLEERCQIAALDLARGILGHHGNDADELGNFEICQAGAAKLLKLLCVGGASKHHRRPDFFAKLGIGHSESGGLGHRWMLEQHGLDFPR